MWKKLLCSKNLNKLKNLENYNKDKGQITNFLFILINFLNKGQKHIKFNIKLLILNKKLGILNYLSNYKLLLRKNLKIGWIKFWTKLKINKIKKKDFIKSKIKYNLL